jgi:hypothetical protein
MFFTGFPQQVSASEQCNREQRHYRGADRYYFGIVLSNKFKDACDAVLITFFFIGPLIGYGLLFLNEWVGGGVLLCWLLFYALSGLWTDQHENKRRYENRLNHSALFKLSNRIQISPSSLFAPQAQVNSFSK